MNPGPSKCNRQGIYKSWALSITPWLLRFRIYPGPNCKDEATNLTKVKNSCFSNFLNFLFFLFFYLDDEEEEQGKNGKGNNGATQKWRHAYLPQKSHFKTLLESNTHPLGAKIIMKINFQISIKLCFKPSCVIISNFLILYVWRLIQMSLKVWVSWPKY